MHLYCGETEAVELSESSHKCRWLSAHLCCAHARLCALSSSHVVLRRFLGEPVTTVGCGICHLLRCRILQLWETTSRKGSSWLGHYLSHRAPGAPATATATASPPSMAPASNLPQMLLHTPASLLLAGEEQGQGCSTRSASERMQTLPRHLPGPASCCPCNGGTHPGTTSSLAGSSLLTGAAGTCPAWSSPGTRSISGMRSIPHLRGAPYTWNFPLLCCSTPQTCSAPRLRQHRVPVPVGRRSLLHKLLRLGLELGCKQGAGFAQLNADPPYAPMETPPPKRGVGAPLTAQGGHGHPWVLRSLQRQLPSRSDESPGRRVLCPPPAPSAAGTRRGGDTGAGAAVVAAAQQQCHRSIPHFSPARGTGCSTGPHTPSSSWSPNTAPASESGCMPTSGSKPLPCAKGLCRSCSPWSWSPLASEVGAGALLVP